MATYQFSTITTAEAQSYKATTDDLRFDDLAAPTATNFEVIWGSFYGPMTIRYLPTGGSVTLPNTAAGDTLTMPDGSKLILPLFDPRSLQGSAAGDNIYGGSGRDTISGLAGDDQITAGELRDLLIGGGGADTLSGGGDRDTFEFAAGDSGTTEGRIDVIAGWQFGDFLHFTTGPRIGAYAEFTAASYASALQAANEQIASGAAKVVAVSVGSDVFVFADTRSDAGVADDAIKLLGATLNVIDSGSFVDFAPAPPPPPPGPTTPPTSDGAATYSFTAITPAQALAYNAAIHDIRFDDPRPGSSTTHFTFNSDGTVTFYEGVTSRSVTFGAGIYGETGFVFTDGTRALLGGPGDDVLFGSHKNDALWAGPGADILHGGLGADRLIGGAGSDLFIVDADEGTRVIDAVLDWAPSDRLTFRGLAANASAYMELTSGGLSAAQAQIESGAADYVAVQGLTGVHVYADAKGLNSVSSGVFLEGAKLDQIDASNIVGSPSLTLYAPASIGSASGTPPMAPNYIGPFASAVGLVVSGNMDLARIGDIRNAYASQNDESALQIVGDGVNLNVYGRGFTYVQDAKFIYAIVSGTVSGFQYLAPDFKLSLTLPNTPASTIFDWVLSGATSQAFPTMLAGDDHIRGEQTSDLLRGYAGRDLLYGYGGDDTVWGGTGDDVIYAGAPPGRVGDTVVLTGSTYLRGEDGHDWIRGGPGFDDLNGNQGNDTGAGGDGDDWVVGGKDNDLLFGEAGRDLVYGNLGNDTCEGGDGNDIVRGGQQDDVINGGSGDDYVSGDKGDDTVTGGSGADNFHTFGDAGLDRVLDFSIAQGDRVQLDPGTEYTVAQSGADTVISMTGGGQMVLVGVQMSSLPGGWIFGA